MNPETLNAIDADAAALAAAGSVAEEALAMHRDALALIAEGWRSQSGCAAVDLLDRQCGDAAELVSALNAAAGEMYSLRGVLEETRVGLTCVGEDPGFAHTAARLGDRPTGSFEAPPSYAAVAPTVQSQTSPPPAWSPESMSIPLPNLGGALIGVVAQLAEALRSDAVGSGAPGSADASSALRASHRPTERPQERNVPPGKPVPVKPPGLPVPLRVNDAVPLPLPLPQVSSAEPPLLAAELPPAVAPALPAPVELPAPPAPAELPAPPGVVELPAPPGVTPRTPCEIAADELPNVGQ